MSRIALCALLLTGSAGAYAGTWANLWSRPDQQAQRLLDSGHAAEAARLLSEPRQRAYAEIKAGHFAEAARRLAPLKDAESQYNRGNALARAGDLPGALKAYDAALAMQPDHRDARHNRDLVARALEQRKQQSKNGEQSGSGASGKQGQSQSGQSSAGRGASGTGQSRTDQSRNQRAQNGRSQSGARTEPASGAQTAPSSASRSSAAQASSEQDRKQAQRDAMAALDDAQKSRRESGSQNGDTANRATLPAGADRAPHPLAAPGAPRHEQESEQALALDQWLRRIPDDPAGLLRRKFLIEHMMKQRETGQ